MKRQKKHDTEVKLKESKIQKDITHVKGIVIF